ncbi:MAG: vitamin K epoxide reductase family protein, partial [Myxococcota bacterium]
EVAGIPIAILGAAFYLAVLVALMVWQSRGQANRWLPHVLVLAFGGAALYSLFLGGISSFVLRSLCWACAGLYLINFTGLFAALRLRSLGRWPPQQMLPPMGCNAYGV